MSNDIVKRLEAFIRHGAAGFGYMTRDTVPVLEDAKAEIARLRQKADRKQIQVELTEAAYVKAAKEANDKHIALDHANDTVKRLEAELKLAKELMRDAIVAYGETKEKG